jgi:Domain of unknown function (DUF1330)
MRQPRKLPDLKISSGGKHAGLFRRRKQIANETGFAPYRAAVNATIAQYGGRFLIRDGATEGCG